MKIEASPALLQKIRAYAEPFESIRPAVFALFPGNTQTLFPFEPESDRGLGVLLLAAALHRPGGEALTARILADLYRAFGTDIFKLNRIPFEKVRETVQATFAAEAALILDEAEQARIPGILRSVCDFFYRVGPLGPWLESAPDWETRAGELCNEIYWMGLRSLTRSKARLFFWLLTRIPDFETHLPAMAHHARGFVWPVSDAHLRFWIDIVKPARTAGARSPEERLSAFAAFGKELFPEAPWRLYLPLDSYLRRDRAGSFTCRTAQDGCRPCPLSALCPAAGQFIPGEGS